MSSPKLEVALEVERDHKHLNKEMAELKTFLVRDEVPDDFAKWRLEFLWQMRDFKNRLLKHFDLEEEGGFMRDVVEAAPHCEHHVDQLRDEHENIDARIDEILKDLKQMAVMDVKKIRGIRTRIGEIMTALRDHESQEQRLIQKAYYREYGGPS